MNLSNGEPSLATLSPSPSPSPEKKIIFELSEQQWRELEDLFLVYPRPTSAHIHGFLQDRPSLSSLDLEILTDWFSARRSKQRREEHLSSLIHTNAKLQAEQYALLLRNRELRSQAMVLDIENQQLKKQLVMQSLRRHPAATSSTPSSLSSLTNEEGRNGSSENEETSACSLDIGFDEVDPGWSSDGDSCSSS